MNALVPREINQRLKGVRILVVDDDPDMLSLNESILKAAGAETLVAGSIREAIERFRSGRPDAILCDLNLGETLDGCDLLRSLNDVIGHVIPAIALSGLPKATTSARALKSGFTAFVQKPANAAALTRAIASSLKSKV
jgi:CheY-like chemotaxis protein